MPKLDFGAALRLAGREPYPEQETISAYFVDAAEHERIALVEAPTATGKTLVLAWNALESAFWQRVVVAVPSIDLIFQTSAAVSALREACSVYEGIRVRIVLGRPEYVDPAQLASAFAGSADAALVEDWVRQGAPGVSPDHPCWTKAGLRHHLQINGRDAQLQEGISLRVSDTQSPSAKAYAEQFDDDADLFIVSHAMLALDLLARFRAASAWQRKEAPSPFGAPFRERLDHEGLARLEADIDGEGRLPDFSHLIVDEAHVLADNVRSVMSYGISLSVLSGALQQAVMGRAVPAALFQQFTRLKGELIKAGAKADHLSSFVDWQRLSNRESKAVAEIGEILATIQKSRLRDLDEDVARTIERAQSALRMARAMTNTVATVVTWSPLQHYPSINVGRPNIRSELGFLWGRLRSAVLVSATLYTINSSANAAGYISQQLALPKGVVAHPAVKGDWLYRPVELFLPGPESAARLAKGDSKTVWAENAHLDQLAREVAGSFDGFHRTLVLTTSLHATARIAKALASLCPGLAIIAGDRKSISEAKVEFMSLPEGVSGVWIAQGPAWTGLDLPDGLITSLYVLKLPMPNPSQLPGRPSYFDFLQNRSKMHIQLKQGMGRLVRSRDASPKKLWCMDPRYADPKFGALPLFERYEKRYF